MLTGDNRLNAESVGKILGLDAIFADLRPEDKLAKVAEFSDLGGLAMVGDGINDAPCSRPRHRWHLDGQDRERKPPSDASDVVLLNDDIHLLSFLFTKARKTQHIVKQNITLALGIICLATIPSLLGFIPIWAAVILHEGGTVLVGLNSLRLLGKG